MNRDNDYARLRLVHYARDWDSLPEWNPAVAPIGKPDGARSLAIAGDARRGAIEPLRALGEDAFFRYPVQRLPSAHVALASRETKDAYGLYEDARARVGSLVRVDGVGDAWVTCATCHARRDPSGLVVGAGNARLDLGRIYVDAGAFADDPARTENAAQWGPGRMDVTTTRGDEPMRIPDLRPIRFENYLHQDATIHQRDLDSLAIRIETLIIVSNGATTRPPREVTLGLARYLWSLADELPPPSHAGESEPRGKAIFDARCAGCHVPPSFSGPPVPLAEIGTEPTVGRSKDRGTGHYRVPSLRGVGTRGPLLHDASIPSIEALFDPTRSVRGHAYGLDLDAASRSDLVRYVRAL